MPSRRPTMHDVARRAGVSLKTVSRVVNGEGGVSPDFTRRVEAAVAELDYRP
ncbi:MAG: LacI family DNA-binding transcriptional regulator, partial [Acidimicrobiia bacterium]